MKIGAYAWGLATKSFLESSPLRARYVGFPSIVWRVRRGLSHPQKTQPFVEVEAL